MACIVAVCLFFSSPEPARLVIADPLLARLQVLAAALHSEVVLCLTGTVDGSSAVATEFVMPDPHHSSPDRASFGSCPAGTVAIWHNHPPERASGVIEPPQGGSYARPRGDPNLSPRTLCALSETDIRTAAREATPFVVVAVDADTWCWWTRDQVRKLAAQNALRGDPVAGQVAGPARR